MSYFFPSLIPSINRCVYIAFSLIDAACLRAHFLNRWNIQLKSFIFLLYTRMSMSHESNQASNVCLIRIWCFVVAHNGQPSLFYSYRSKPKTGCKTQLSRTYNTWETNEQHADILFINSLPSCRFGQNCVA